MHGLIEGFLDQVARGLGSLPVERRQDEIKEMRQHLLNAVLVNRQMGQTEDEAVATAVEQFGTPEAVGESLVWAWRRGQTRWRRSFWGTAACAFLLADCLPFLQDTPWEASLSRLSHSLGYNSLTGTPVQLALFALVGGLCGLIFPKRSFSGIVFGMTAWYVSFLTIAFVILNLDRLPSLPSTSLSDHFLSVLFAILAAWTSGRWKPERTGAAREFRA